MRNRRRRRISAGTLLLIILTVSSLGVTAWLLLMLTDSMQDLKIDTQRLFGVQTASLQTENLQQNTAVGASAASTVIEETAPPTAQPEFSEPPTRMLRVAVAGNIYVPKNVRQSGYDQETGLYTYNETFNEIQGLFSNADLSICTVESTFTGQDFSDYNAPDAMLDALKFAGINLLSLGNERALDKGVEGLRTTVNAMETKGFWVAGAVPYKEDMGDIRLLQINGVQIAVLAYSYGISKDGLRRTGKEDYSAVPLLEETSMRNDIANARKAGADVIIVLPHWGTRNSAKVTPAQRTMGEQLASMGADLVVGAHPNAVQRVDRVLSEGKDGKTRETLVAYSLGSMLTDSRDLAAASSMVMCFDFQVDPAAHTARLVRYGYVPIWLQRDRVSSGKYAYSVLRADDDDIAAMVNDATRRRLTDARITVQRTLGDGIEVPAYWP